METCGGTKESDAEIIFLLFWVYFLLTLENFICCTDFLTYYTPENAENIFFGKFFHCSKRSVKSLIFMAGLK